MACFLMLTELMSWNSCFFILLTLVFLGPSGVLASSLSLGQNSFSGTDSVEASSLGFSFFAFDFESDFKEKGRIDAGAMRAFDEREFYYFRLSEAYVSPQYTKEFSIVLGRKILSPLSLEEQWQLGLVEPVFKWNPLRPERQGLVAIGSRWESERWQFQAAFLPLFIPDQGANYKIDDGQFTQTNPWFRAPPDKVVVLGDEARTKFNIEMPETKDVVLRSGYFLSGGYQDSSGFYTQALLTEKPTNQAALGFQGVLKIDGETDRLPITVRPEFVRHQVVGGELGFKNRQWKLAMSGLHERLTTPEFDSSWTYQSFSPGTFLSPSVAWQNKWANLTLAYLEKQGDENTLKGRYAGTVPDNLLPGRMPFQKASMLAVETRFSSLLVALKWISDLDQTSDLVSSDIHYEVSREMRLWASFDLISYPEKGLATEDFFALKTREDRTGIGVQYVF